MSRIKASDSGLTKTIDLTMDEVIELIRTNPRLKFYAMPEKYCPTGQPVVLMSYEDFQNFIESKLNDSEVGE